MRRAVSIHIGVNRPGGPARRALLSDSEDAAWKMAVLASQAGYESLQVLRGRAATRFAVHNALAGAAGMLESGDNLLVTYSGHGGQVADLGDKETHDESWCLFDGDLSDDKLAGYWRVFDHGVRIVVVSESCFSGGMFRTGGHGLEDPMAHARDRMRDGSPFLAGTRPRGEPATAADTSLRMRDGGASVSAAPAAGAGGQETVSCITEPPRDPNAIRASVLMLTASGESETAGDGLYTRALLRVWDEGRFRGSYCKLHTEVKQQVMAERQQQPQILIMGTATPEFALETAFHVDRTRMLGAMEIRYRGEGEERMRG